jgi:putative ABC transport system permease protein
VQGDPMDSAHNVNSRQRSVSPGFFSAMGIKLLTGRDFDGHDRQGSTPVVIINHAFATRYLSGRDPLTVQFMSGYPAIDTRTVFTVVGVVDDVRQRALTLLPEPAYYNTSGQGTPRRQSIIVHAPSADARVLWPAIRDEVRKVDPQIPVDIERVPDIVSGTLNRQQLGMTLMLVFAGAAIALAAVGIYGVIAYSAAQRRREVAIRLALGATQGNVFRLVLKQGRTLALIGAALGVFVAYLAGGFVSAWLYEVRASDPVILGAAAALVVGIALVATVIPAYRVARMDPGKVLRPE